MNKLKPVIFVQGKYQYNTQNTARQVMLLNALKITQDPKKLRQLIGVKTVADVFRELDKIAMRKEYHSALTKAGISFDYVVKGIKSEIDSGDKSSDRLNALNMILKSLGMDKYEESATTKGSWEEELLKLSSPEDVNIPPLEIAPYEVPVPEMPEHIRLAKEKANKEAKGLYD